VGRALLNILWTTAPDAAIAGRAYFASERGEVDLFALSRRKLRPYRGDLQMILQDPTRRSTLA